MRNLWLPGDVPVYGLVHGKSVLPTYSSDANVMENAEGGGVIIVKRNLAGKNRAKSLRSVPTLLLGCYYTVSSQWLTTPPPPPPLPKRLLQLTSQFRMGTFLEERWGTRNWLIIYWVGGLGGNLLSCVASPDKVCRFAYLFVSKHEGQSSGFVLVCGFLCGFQRVPSPTGERRVCAPTYYTLLL